MYEFLSKMVVYNSNGDFMRKKSFCLHRFFLVPSAKLQTTEIKIFQACSEVLSAIV